MFPHLYMALTNSKITSAATFTALVEENQRYGVKTPFAAAVLKNPAAYAAYRDSLEKKSSGPAITLETISDNDTSMFAGAVRIQARQGAKNPFAAAVHKCPTLYSAWRESKERGRK